jgi:O-methyltransferase
MVVPSYRSRFFWGVPNLDAFQAALDGVMAATTIKQGWFAGDNLIAFGRNLGFLSDARLIKAWTTHAKDIHERGVLWRTATVVWAARQALRREGDFVECGCYKGTSARILIDSVDLDERKYFLYDLFEHDASMNHNAMPDHGAGLFDATKARFADFPNVTVIKGPVPESFSQGLPEKIAFAHIDMNNAPAEIGALDAIEDRLVPGAIILLDDFGAMPYRAQHIAETEWFGKRGIPVLELPTSQGLAIW